VFFSQSLRANYSVVLQIRIQSFPCTSSSTKNYLLVILTFERIYAEFFFFPCIPYEAVNISGCEVEW
jgi:hypothetical protein